MRVRSVGPLHSDPTCLRWTRRAFPDRTSQYLSDLEQRALRAFVPLGYMMLSEKG
jgi:hypothetical protein